MIKEANLPAGWPDATPVGKVQIKEYPTYRAATVREGQLDGTGQGPMFRELFQHIKRNQIAMTAQRRPGRHEHVRQNPFVLGRVGQA